MAITQNEKLVFLKKGKEVEAQFAKLFNDAVPASEEEDIKEHWDVKVVTKIDVKGLRKKNRSDANVDENFHWVELSNVHGGKRTGSLYGMADYFSFETYDYFIMVCKLKLQEFIESKCKGKKLEKTKEPYTLYRRDGRKDIIVKVKTIDLCYISDKILKKQK